jgi:hypothetical protein
MLLVTLKILVLNFEFNREILPALTASAIRG